MRYKNELGVFDPNGLINLVKFKKATQVNSKERRFHKWLLCALCS